MEDRWKRRTNTQGLPVRPQACCLITVVALFALFAPSSPQVALKEMVVGSITFEGAASLKQKDLKERMRTREAEPFDEFQLRQDVKRLESFYAEKGFLGAKVTEHRLSWDPENMRVDVKLTVEEGVQTRVRTISVTGNDAVRGKQILKRVVLKSEQPLDEEAVALSELGILSLYARSGHIYCEVTTSPEPTGEPHWVDLIFRVKEGPLVRVGRIGIRGRQRVRARIVEREITFREGDVYDPDKIYESQRRIYGTGLFKDVKLELAGMEEKREVVDVTFRVTEEGPRWFGVGGGYQSPDRMQVNAEWGHNNVFNNGQRLSIRGSYSFNLKGQHREEFEGRHLEPYFISSPFRLLVNPFHYRERGESYRTTETGGRVTLGRYFGSRLYGSLQGKYKVATVDTFRQEQRPELELEATTNSLTLSLTRDTRDSFFDPKRGSLNLLSAERAGGIFGGSNNFSRFTIDSSIFLAIWKRATLAMRLKEGYTLTFGSTTPEKVSPDERFELGGANSVRGYQEASIGPQDPITQERDGIIMTNVNLELRFPLPAVKNLQMGYFLDGGGMWMERMEMSVKDMKWGAGVGLRWIIPYLGPLRFDWGWKLAPEQDEDRWKWYVAFGHAF